VPPTAPPMMAPILIVEDECAAGSVAEAAADEVVTVEVTETVKDWDPDTVALSVSESAAGIDPRTY